MIRSGIHAHDIERASRGYQWFWSLQNPQHPQPVPTGGGIQVLTKQELPWHPAPMLGNAVIVPSTFVQFSDFSFHAPFSALGMRINVPPGGVIRPGFKGFLTVPFNCNIVRMLLCANIAGSVVVDIYRLPAAAVASGSVPGPTNTLIQLSGFRPQLNNAQSFIDTALFSWSTRLTKGDLLSFNVPSTAGIGSMMIALFVQRNSMP